MDGMLTILFYPFAVAIRLIQTIVEAGVFLLYTLVRDGITYQSIVAERKSVIHIDPITLRLAVHIYEQPPMLEISIADSIIKSLILKA